MAVSKRHSADAVAVVARMGQQHFGENYLQEALEKQDLVSSLLKETGEPDPKWHFIGHIQSRKCRDIAENFDWVHTVETEKVARRLNDARATDNPLNVLIQLNLQQESSKSGIPASSLEDLAESIRGLDSLHLRGLMIIPRPEPDFDKQRVVFAELRHHMEELNNKGYTLDQLSMGMTDDMEAAIAEGATMIRIGTAIFGQRPD